MQRPNAHHHKAPFPNNRRQNYTLSLDQLAATAPPDRPHDVMTQKLALGFRIVAHVRCRHSRVSICVLWLQSLTLMLLVLMCNLQALPAVILVLVGIWMGSALTQYVKAGDLVMEKSLAGFSWAYADGRVFNWHPFLMTFGFVFCSTQAALAYISLPFSHDTNKVSVLCVDGAGSCG